MLGRTADNLYWIGRYVERAENTARLLDVTYRMALLPSVADKQESQWRPAVMVGPDPEAFVRRYGQPSAESVIEYMAFDAANPSSIRASLAQARENARAERIAISSEMWESLNATWLDLEQRKVKDLKRDGPRAFFDWVKERSHLFRGVAFGTMYRNEAFHFLRLGTFLERADNTARILDVKFHLLLPETEKVGGSVDYYQWGALLRSVSAFRAYRLAYRDTIEPRKVAELLVLDPAMPRSLHHCFEAATDILESLAPGKRIECKRVAGEMHADLRYGRIDRLFDQGLHEFLEHFMQRNNALSETIQRDFSMSLQYG